MFFSSSWPATPTATSASFFLGFRQLWYSLLFFFAWFQQVNGCFLSLSLSLSFCFDHGWFFLRNLQLSSYKILWRSFSKRQLAPAPLQNARSRRARVKPQLSQEQRSFTRCCWHYDLRVVRKYAINMLNMLWKYWPTDDDAERRNVLPKIVFCHQQSILECLTLSQKICWLATGETETATLTSELEG